MHKLFLLSLFSLAGLFIGQQQVFAQSIAAQPCDPQVYEQMRSRAWLEAEREIMQNQSLIFKADSVLTYTCFDQFLGKASWEGGDIFTHTDYFSSPIITRGSSYAVERAMSNVVGSAVSGFVGGSFGSLLGGRSPDITPPVVFPTKKKYAYTCDIMSQVWAKSKCLNFVHNKEFAGIDGFYPFEEILAFGFGDDIAGYDTITDIRKYGGACNSESSLTSWGAELINAQNVGGTLYAYQTPLGVVFDDVADRTIPGKCGAAILTGVEVVLADGPSHQDGVCTNPGCTFEKSGTCN